MSTPGTSTPGMSTPARRIAGRAGQYAALLCYLVFLAFPLVWLVSTSFKSPTELGEIDPTWIPRHPTLENFRSAFEAQPLARSALNSLTVAGGATLVSVAIAVPAAYVLARHRSKVSSAANGWVLVSQMVPFVLVIIPLFLVLKNLRLIDSVGGLIVVYVVWNLPFSLWMLQGYVRAVPVSLEEAAAVDGAGRLRILRSVVLPLLAPGLVATLMFSFVTAWNEFFFALALHGGWWCGSGWRLRLIASRTVRSSPTATGGRGPGRAAGVQRFCSGCTLSGASSAGLPAGAGRWMCGSIW